MWALSFSGTPTWTQLFPGGTPPASRLGHSAIYDPAADRMVVFAGGRPDFGPTTYQDVWALSLGGSPAWTPLAPSGTAPPGRFWHNAFYSSQLGGMVVHGGGTPFPFMSTRNDVWLLGLSGSPGWTPIAALGGPPEARHSHSGVFDPTGSRMFVYGGWDVVEGTRNDLWALQWPATVGAGNPADLNRLKPYPNPARASAHLRFELARDAHVRVSVYDLSGRVVATVADTDMPAGPHEVRWDGRASGARVRSGLYLYRVETGTSVETRKFILLDP